MNFETIEGILNINLNSTMTLALAAILLIMGYSINKRVSILNKYCIPAPVVGGFIFMFLTWIGHVTGSFKFNFENIFQSTFMLAFFTTVGLGASFALLKKGGKLLIIYWLTCGIISICQNIIGITITKITGLEAPYALLSSAISMVGGHGAALAYGGTFAKMGYENAPLVGAAAATFGLITAVFILVCMAIGSYISTLIGKLINMDFPSYVGAMFMAVIVRNINEKTHTYNFNFSLVDGIGNVMLNLYLALALMTLKLWELSGLIGGVLLVVGCQVLFMILVAYFIVFRILGSNYDAAVMCSGLCGHGLGATPSAIVNMTAINEKYGMSRKAMMIVPIVGAFLVDIIYQPATVWFIKTFVENYVG